MWNRWSELLTGVVLLATITGCSAGQPVSTAPSAVHHYANGQILSKQSLPTGNVMAKVFAITYWSQGHRVDAAYSEPRKPGQYPLLIVLHGGFLGHPEVRHAVAPELGGGTAAATAENWASGYYDILYPLYQGYGGSTGTVRGLHTNMENTLDAVRAVTSLGEVNTHRLYVLGVSMGGGGWR